MKFLYLGLWLWFDELVLALGSMSCGFDEMALGLGSINCVRRAGVGSRFDELWLLRRAVGSSISYGFDELALALGSTSYGFDELWALAPSSRRLPPR